MDRGFPPIADRNARILILGSLPGQASLAARRYYAHPRNAFWPILARFVGFAVDAPYATRAASLRRAGIAVWDVCEAASRPGSLDSAIDGASVQPNDFASFFATHSQIARVAFNGAAAARLYRLHKLPESGLEFVRLPSTSPAYAAMGFAGKCAAWTAELSKARA
ncbi:MAG: DNA-deoxyinosine glycosylase [Proteobacteria bacterium]|nr:DNA-deoxyinosine glycosylase [Pseudomonadota bacterium]